MKYLHGSRKLFGKDFELTPQKDGYTSFEEVAQLETYVELRRPADKLSRLECVFLCTDVESIDHAGGYTDAVYEVKPSSTPEMSDLAWYSEAAAQFESKFFGGTYDTVRLDECIDNYWSGRPFERPENSCIEYRTKSARVVRMVEHNVNLKDLEVVRAGRSPNLNA